MSARLSDGQEFQGVPEMLPDTLVFEDPSPSKMTRFAERLWAECPNLIAMVGEKNINVVEVPPTVGGIGDRLVRRVEINLSALFYEDMLPERAEELVNALIAVREIVTSVGIIVDEKVEDFLITGGGRKESPLSE